MVEPSITSELLTRKASLAEPFEPMYTEETREAVARKILDFGMRTAQRIRKGESMFFLGCCCPLDELVEMYFYCEALGGKGLGTFQEIKWVRRETKLPNELATILILTAAERKLDGSFTGPLNLV